MKKKIGSSDAMTYLKIGLGCVAIGGALYLTWPLISAAVRRRATTKPADVIVQPATRTS
jgi:hypothetical protein